MSDETVRVPAALVEAARHPYKGPNDTDASMLRAAADRIRDLYAPGGSNTREQVVRVLNSVADLLDAAERTDEGEVPKRVCGDVGYGWSGEEIIEADAPRRPCVSEHGDAAKCRKCYPAPAAPVEDCEHGNDVRYGCKHCDESGTVDTSSPRRTRDEGMPSRDELIELVGDALGHSVEGCTCFHDGTHQMCDTCIPVAVEIVDALAARLAGEERA